MRTSLLLLLFAKSQLLMPTASEAANPKSAGAQEVDHQSAAAIQAHRVRFNAKLAVYLGAADACGKGAKGNYKLLREDQFNSIVQALRTIKAHSDDAKNPTPSKEQRNIVRDFHLAQLGDKTLLYKELSKKAVKRSRAKANKDATREIGGKTCGRYVHEGEVFDILREAHLATGHSATARTNGYQTLGRVFNVADHICNLFITTCAMCAQSMRKIQPLKRQVRHAAPAARPRPRCPPSCPSPIAPIAPLPAGHGAHRRGAPPAAAASTAFTTASTSASATFTSAASTRPPAV